jgi:hypothetical protein
MAGTHTTKAQWWHGVLGCQTPQHSYAGKTRAAILVTSPNMLCARVLKGKYFLNDDFMTAKNKKTSSHTWRAILAGRKALGCVLIRRISDGETTNIWRDRWISSAIRGRPICPLCGALAMRVCELLVANDVSKNS